MELNIYKRTVCRNCEQITAILNARNIDYNAINIDEDAQAFQKIKARGFMEAPVLTLMDGDTEVDHASGKAIMDIMRWDKAGYLTNG